MAEFALEEVSDKEHPIRHLRYENTRCETFVNLPGNESVGVPEPPVARACAKPEEVGQDSNFHKLSVKKSKLSVNNGRPGGA